MALRPLLNFNIYKDYKSKGFATHHKKHASVVLMCIKFSSVNLDVVVHQLFEFTSNLGKNWTYFYFQIPFSLNVII